MSETGLYKRFQNGMTLIEVLVTLFIVSAVIGGAVLAMPGVQEDREREAVERWLAQARWAVDQSLSSGTVFAWQLAHSGASVQARKGERWQPHAAPIADLIPLPVAMRITAIQVEGLPLSVPAQIVFRLGATPGFVLTLRAAKGDWTIVGSPSGRIEQSFAERKQSL